MLKFGLALLWMVPTVAFAGIEPPPGFTVVTDDREIDSNSFVQSLFGISDETEVRTPAGVIFDESVLTASGIGMSQGNGSAAQTSNLAPSIFSGFGSTTSFATPPAMGFDLIEVTGASIFDVTFNVGAAALYDVTAALMTSLTGNGTAGASFLLSVVGGPDLVSTSVMGGDDAELATQIMLMPGVLYQLLVRGSSAAFDGGDASASWNFNLATAVPEPATFVLLTLGLLGFAASRRPLL